MAPPARGNARTEAREFDRGENTLGELRAFIALCDGMPDEARVNGIVRLGGALRQISAVDDGRAGRT